MTRQVPRVVETLMGGGVEQSVLSGEFAVPHYVSERAVVRGTMAAQFAELCGDAKRNAQIGSGAPKMSQLDYGSHFRK